MLARFPLNEGDVFPSLNSPELQRFVVITSQHSVRSSWIVKLIEYFRVIIAPCTITKLPFTNSFAILVKHCFKPIPSITQWPWFCLLLQKCNNNDNYKCSLVLQMTIWSKSLHHPGVCGALNLLEHPDNEFTWHWWYDFIMQMLSHCDDIMGRWCKGNNIGDCTMKGWYEAYNVGRVITKRMGSVSDMWSHLTEIMYCRCKWPCEHTMHR